MNSQHIKVNLHTADFTISICSVFDLLLNIAVAAILAKATV